MTDYIVTIGFRCMECYNSIAVKTRTGFGQFSGFYMTGLTLWGLARNGPLGTLEICGDCKEIAGS